MEAIGAIGDTSGTPARDGAQRVGACTRRDAAGLTGKEASVRVAWRLVMGVGLAVSLAACAHHARAGGNESQPDAYVTVDNQSFSDMDIYVLSGGQRIRLGSATGERRTRMKIPGYVIGGTQQVRFLARPIAGNRLPVTEQIPVQPGDEVTLTIPPNASP